MQRHLALLRYLFPMHKRRSLEPESVEEVLARTNHRLQELHTNNRARAVLAITQKNQVLVQVEDLKRAIQNLEQKVVAATKRGDQEIADQLLLEKSNYEQSLVTAEEMLQQAVETAEQVKAAIKREEDQIIALTAELRRFKGKWEGCALQHEMQQQLESLGIWHLARPAEPEIDRKTAQELIGFLLLVILVVVGLLIFRK